MSTQPDRPETLKRRQPRPAADEAVDPVSYRPDPAAAPPAEVPAEPAPAAASPALEAQPAGPVRRGPGRPPGREATVQLGVRISLEASAVLDELAATDGTARAALENAIHHYAAQRGQTA